MESTVHGPTVFLMNGIDDKCRTQKNSYAPAKEAIYL